MKYARAFKLLCIVPLLIAATSLGGCSFTTQLTGFEAWFSSPQTQATIGLIGKAGVAIICDVSAGAGLAAGAAAVAVPKSKSTSGTINKVYTISSQVCASLGGNAVGQVSVPAGTAVLQ